jgi:DNA-binding NtrC family response regulator
MTTTASSPGPDIVVGTNPRMRALFDYIRIIGPGQGTVLITGESGTGKEVVATLLHNASTRRDKPFVAVSCALFSDTLIESELFGHERGAFTGAVSARLGRFERAEGGTLFLDDIDDVPLSMQVKLLRALQNRTIERLGGAHPVPVNVRVIAGTKRDLRDLVRTGQFREDLFYRLNVLTVNLPPLRERPEDVPVLIDHFLRRYFGRRGVPMPDISETARRLLAAYNWPGNVRELENMCERIAESCTCGHVRLGCLGASVLFPAADAETPTPAIRAAAPDMPPVPLDQHLREIEAGIITAVLKKTGGNKSRAAELLGIRRSTLGDRIQKLASVMHPEMRD